MSYCGVCGNHDGQECCEICHRVNRALFMFADVYDPVEEAERILADAHP